MEENEMYENGGDFESSMFEAEAADEENTESMESGGYDGMDLFDSFEESYGEGSKQDETEESSYSSEDTESEGDNSSESVGDGGRNGEDADAYEEEEETERGSTGDEEEPGVSSTETEDTEGAAREVKHGSMTCEEAASVIETMLTDSNRLSGVNVGIRERGKQKLIIVKYKNKDRGCTGLFQVRTPADAGEAVEKIEKLLKGFNVTDKLNKYISESGYCGDIEVEYRPGIEADTKVVEWSYNRIIFRLSMDATEAAVMCRDMLDSLIDSSRDYYKGSIVSIIVGFNGCSLHKNIGAYFNKDDSIYDILGRMMYHRKDILHLALTGKGNGKSKVRSIIQIEDVGYIGIAVWTIDFRTRSVTTEILGNRILDVPNDKYIYNDEVISNIIKLVGIKVYELSEVFDTE